MVDIQISQIVAHAVSQRRPPTISTWFALFVVFRSPFIFGGVTQTFEKLFALSRACGLTGLLSWRCGGNAAGRWRRLHVAG